MNASLRRISTAIFIILAGLISGCGPEISEPAPLCSYLPEPAIPRVDRAALTPEAALRKCEVEKLVAERHREHGYRIVATTENYSGDIMDWMAAESVPGSEQPPPPPISLDGLQLPPGVQLGKSELEMYPELTGPVGTVGMHRMTFPAYVDGETGASSLEEFLQQYEEQPGQPAGQDRLYAGYRFKNISHGTVSFVNAFNGPPIEPGTMSLLEMAIVCPGNNPSTTLEMIGIATSRDLANFGYTDSGVRLQVEFYTQGGKTGNQIGGWHGSKNNYTGFVRRADSLYKPGDLLLTSTVGGPQYEHRFEILWFEGNWWLAYQGDWLGFYPGYLFAEIGSYACELLWYMEVYDGTPEDWTYTDGGSGEFAKYGYPYAAYFNRIYYLDIVWQTHWLFTADAWASGPYDPACYTATPLEVTWTPGSENRFYCSGPGKDAIKAPDCH